MMKQEHRQAVISDFNRLLVEIGGSLLKEQRFETVASAETSHQITTTLALATEIAEIAWRWVADLKQKANTLSSPIYSIPTELLQRILETALDKTEADHYYRDLHRLQSVSARWCQAIGNLPRLWTLLTTKMPAQTVNTIAERSQGLPLTIDYGYEPAEAQPASILLYQERWESLSVRSDDWGPMTTFLSISYPKLTSMKLFGTCDRKLLHFVQKFLSKSLSIRRLHITGWGFTWGGHFATSVRSLTLTNIRGRALKLEDLIRTLSCCAELISLRVENVTFHDLDLGAQDVVDHPADLPSLQNLFIGFNRATSTTLKGLVIPHSAQITLTATNTHYRPGPVFLEWMGHTSIEWSCPNSISVEKGEDGRFTMSYGEGHFRILSVEMEFSDLARILLSLDSIKREAVKKVVYAQLDSFGPAYDHAHRLDELFPSATHFTLGVSDAFESKMLLEGLSTRQAKKEDHSEKWLFPRLEHFTIRGPVVTVDLISFASARIAAANAQQVARLADITAFGVTGTDAERRSLGQLVTIIGS